MPRADLWNYVFFWVFLGTFYQANETLRGALAGKDSQKSVRYPISMYKTTLIVVLKSQIRTQFPQESAR